MTDPHLLSLAGLLLPGALICLLAASRASASQASPQACSLRTEHRDGPMGIDSPQPLLSWQFAQQGRSRAQSAYRIQADEAASGFSSASCLFDSGKVQSAQSLCIPLTGMEMKSGTAYVWRVKVWDGDGSEGDWSEPATFETGLLCPEDWQAEWITSPIGGNGYHSGIDSDPDVTKWVQVDLGEPKEISSVRLFPARPYNWNEDTPGFGYPVRFRIEVSDDAEFATSQVVVDRTAEDQPNPKDDAQELGFETVRARYVRLTVTRLYTRIDSQKLFALAELQVLNAAGENLSAGRPVSALDSTEAHGWSREFLTEGVTRSTESSRVAPLFRREFSLTAPVRRARAYVCGLGYYELRINGEKVGDRVLDPPYTNFESRSYYSTYDVTDALRAGANAVGAIIGRGWYGRSPSLILRIEADLEDGSRQSLVTDGAWKRGKSPILDNSLYHGETYDARKEQPAWDQPGFDDSGWEPAVVIDSPTQRLSAQTIQPIRVTETLPAQSVKAAGNGWVFDFGQNFSGWCRLKVSAPAGTVVTLRHAELLYPDGTVNQENLRAARATDTYITKGEGAEVYEPRFTYHGFRYVQVEGLPGQPDAGETLTGQVVHTDFPMHGRFECSNGLINTIQRNSVWGFRTNFHSIPTDCPQRDERQGWMGDAGMTVDSGCYNFDVAAAYTKFLQDIADAQGEDGRVPDTVPHIWGTNPGDPMWSAAYFFIAWDMYRHTADREMLRTHYAGLQRYARMLEREAKGYIIERNNYGDWVGVVETPKDLISTGSFHLAARILADIARILENPEDARFYDHLGDQIAKAFNERFYDEENGCYGNGSQFSQVWPLHLGIVPAEKRQRVADHLVNDILVEHKGHLSTGFLGARYLFETLCEIGRPDVAYTVVTQKDYPGYGYMIENGATTIWELWKLETGPGMNSHNHPAFGFISGWFYRDIAGIVPDWKSPGFEHFDIRPHVMGDLTDAEAAVDTVRGRVASRWARDADGLTLEVSIPANSTASVWAPKAGMTDVAIREEDRDIWQSGAFVPGVEGVSAGEDTGEWVRLECGSGAYSFRVEGE